MHRDSAAPLRLGRADVMPNLSTPSTSSARRRSLRRLRSSSGLLNNLEPHEVLSTYFSFFSSSSPPLLLGYHLPSWTLPLQQTDGTRFYIKESLQEEGMAGYIQ